MNRTKTKKNHFGKDQIKSLEKNKLHTTPQVDSLKQYRNIRYLELILLGNIEKRYLGSILPSSIVMDDILGRSPRQYQNDDETLGLFSQTDSRGG